MMKAAWKWSLLLLCGMPGTVKAIDMRDPATDYAFVDLEPYPSFGGERFHGPAVAESGDRRAWRLADELTFPAGKVGETQFFGIFKSTLMDRDIVYNDSLLLNDGILQRYWLSGGLSWPGSNGQSSMALVGVGVNSDFADISLFDFNTEWIYSHSWVWNPSLTFGLGIDVQQYFHKYQPYPLIFVDWKITDRTKFKWDADYVEVRHFFDSRLCYTAGVRFNLEFFALKQNADFEYNSMGLEAGLQYALGRNFYARLKYKELVWGHETLGLPDGSQHKRALDAGRSLRLSFAYGV